MNHVLVWVGVAILVVWAVLWLSVKIAAIGVHLLLLLGLAFIIWGLMKRTSQSSP
jgi:uncharacterized membrane protein YqjE